MKKLDHEILKSAINVVGNLSEVRMDYDSTIESHTFMFPKMPEAIKTAAEFNEYVEDTVVPGFYDFVMGRFNNLAKRYLDGYIYPNIILEEDVIKIKNIFKKKSEEISEMLLNATTKDLTYFNCNLDWLKTPEAKHSSKYLLCSSLDNCVSTIFKDILEIINKNNIDTKYTDDDTKYADGYIKEEPEVEKTTTGKKYFSDVLNKTSDDTTDKVKKSEHKEEKTVEVVRKFFGAMNFNNSAKGKSDLKSEEHAKEEKKAQTGNIMNVFNTVNVFKTKNPLDDSTGENKAKETEESVLVLDCKENAEVIIEEKKEEEKIVEEPKHKGSKSSSKGNKSESAQQLPDNKEQSQPENNFNEFKEEKLEIKYPDAGSIEGAKIEIPTQSATQSAMKDMLGKPIVKFENDQAPIVPRYDHETIIKYFMLNNKVLISPIDVNEFKTSLLTAAEFITDYDDRKNHKKPSKFGVSNFIDIRNYKLVRIDESNGKAKWYDETSVEYACLEIVDDHYTFFEKNENNILISSKDVKTA